MEMCQHCLCELSIFQCRLPESKVLSRDPASNRWSLLTSQPLIAVLTDWSHSEARAVLLDATLLNAKLSHQIACFWQMFLFKATRNRMDHSTSAVSRASPATPRARNLPGTNEKPNYISRQNLDQDERMWHDNGITLLTRHNKVC